MDVPAALAALQRRARTEGADPQRAAEVRFMRFFINTPMAMMIIGILDFLVRVVRLIGVCRLTSACCGV